MFELIHQGPRLTEARLIEVVGLDLPSEYRDFMLEQNGGVLRESAHLPGDGSGASVRAFLSVDSGGRAYDLSDYLQTYRGRYPDGFLPIAVDASSNLILLDLGYERVGSIWFWDHEGEADEEEPARVDNIIRLADSFTGFVEDLETGFTPDEEALIADDGR